MNPAHGASVQCSEQRLGSCRGGVGDEGGHPFCQSDGHRARQTVWRVDRGHIGYTRALNAVHRRRLGTSSFKVTLESEPRTILAALVENDSESGQLEPDETQQREHINWMMEAQEASREKAAEG